VVRDVLILILILGGLYLALVGIVAICVAKE
jgi:hypothetical protein